MMKNSYLTDDDNSISAKILPSLSSSENETDTFSHADNSRQGRRNSKVEEGNALLGKNETQNVNRLRMIVGIVLTLSTLSIALTIYFYIRNGQESDFNTAYTYDTDRILGGIGMSLQNSLEAMDAFGTMMVSIAKETNQTFPFFTLPSFAVKASRLLTSTAAVQISVQIVVTSENRLEWEAYSMENQWWVNETKEVQDVDQFYFDTVPFGAPNPPQLWNYTGVIPYDPDRRYLPQWQNYPTIDPAFNWDFLTASLNTTPYSACVDDRISTLSCPYNVPDPNDEAGMQEKQFWSDLFQRLMSDGQDPSEPFSDFWYPVTEDMDSKETFTGTNYSQYPVVATIDSMTYWRDFIVNLLPKSSQGILIYFENACNGSFTYQFFGPTVKYLGRGDYHDPKYNSLVISKPLHETITMYRYSGVSLDSEHCPFTISLYPSDQYQSTYVTNSPVVFSVGVVLIFAFVSFIFFVYDVSVERRQKLVLNTAEKTSAIVSSLFPSAVRDQMLHDTKQSGASTKPNRMFGTVESRQDNTTKAMATLYPETTVFFADLAGFTAWSSSRTPCQVFTLLEELYGAFDHLASRRKVFKVETIGDCYVAVTGLPEPLKNHAVVMARFATECLNKTSELTGQLVATLGIETGDLRIRIGINSGPTTAGVLRGEKARFQLFGDTVNTAARMESTGIPGRIQVSQKTADLLIAAGKEAWVAKRSTAIDVKGKGAMVTYWLQMSGSNQVCQSTSSGQSENHVKLAEVCDNTNQLVEWNVGIFKELMQQVVASNLKSSSKSIDTMNDDIVDVERRGTPLTEISETVETKMFNKQSVDRIDSRQNYTLGKAIEDQLREFIVMIAYMYKPNPFHNFEHASHVVMSTMKLLDRIRTHQQEATDSDQSSTCLYLDPLTQLGVVFAALIHDADHLGMSNKQLIDEGLPIAKVYSNKSIAEQNSIDVVWSVFMNPEFNDLRQCIFSCSDDLRRFRQVVVNSVLATDIFDKDLKSFREDRWNQVFSNSLTPSQFDDVNNIHRKNAIVIEHLIQASDVVHTMQHWKVYQKWNKRLFFEMYSAYHRGLAKESPSNGWYSGELWFFDNYIIPLAKKLRICGVFGVSCDELLDYAMDNRAEWEHKGKEIVVEWEKEVKKALE